MKTCPACRAANLDSAVVCVSCQSSLGEVPMPAPLVQTAGPDLPPDPALRAAEKEAQARRAVIGAIAIGAALVIGIAVLVVVLTRGDGFPEAIGGKPRIQSDEVKQIEDLLEGQEIQGMTFDMAFYGTGDEPSVIVLIMRGQGDALGAAAESDEFWDAFGKGFAQGFASTSGGAVTRGKPLTQEKDGVRYYCVGFRATGGDGSLCLFVDQEIGMLMSTTFENPRDTVVLAEEAAAAL